MYLMLLYQSFYLFLFYFYKLRGHSIIVIYTFGQFLARYVRGFRDLLGGISRGVIDRHVPKLVTVLKLPQFPYWHDTLLINVAVHYRAVCFLSSEEIIPYPSSPSSPQNVVLLDTNLKLSYRHQQLEKTVQ